MSSTKIVGDSKINIICLFLIPVFIAHLVKVQEILFFFKSQDPYYPHFFY